MNALDREFEGACGIYAILCLLNGKFYIGSSRNLCRRNRDHRRMLKHDKHHSTYLQNAYNKYGASAFVFNVIERCTFSILKAREQWYLDSFKPFSPDIGYNTNPVAGWNTAVEMAEATKQKIRNRALNRIPSPETIDKLRRNWIENHEKYTSYAIETRGEAFRIKSPSGEVFEGVGIRDFCRKHDLDHSQFTRVLRGENGQVKGWRLPESESPTYQFSDPLGVPYVVVRGDIKCFAKQHGLGAVPLGGVWSKRLDHHKGWCRTDRLHEMYTRVVHDDGLDVLLCKRDYMKHAHLFGLHPVTFTRLMGGSHTKVGGWRLEPVNSGV